MGLSAPACIPQPGYPIPALGYSNHNFPDSNKYLKGIILLQTRSYLVVLTHSHLNQSPKTWLKHKKPPTRYHLIPPLFWRFRNMFIFQLQGVRPKLRGPSEAVSPLPPVEARHPEHWLGGYPSIRQPHIFHETGPETTVKPHNHPFLRSF